MGNKILDFQARISDVEQVSPLFSTCKVRVLHTGKNRNMSFITKDSIINALPSLKNIPIVGEFSVEKKDYKSHGGTIDLDSYDFVHTTKPYGVVPESATFAWEDVVGSDGIIREYLTVSGCYLWTGRYEEAYSVVENGKSQSMEIEVTNGKWIEEEEVYQIDNFLFSALCILGDDVEPAFEDSKIIGYSISEDLFKQDFTQMMRDLKFSLTQDTEFKEVDNMLKELLEKYSLTVEDLTAKGIDFNKISDNDLEAKIIEVFNIEVEDVVEDIVEDVVEDIVEEEIIENFTSANDNEEIVESELTDAVYFEAHVDNLDLKLGIANKTINDLNLEINDLKEFKLNIEKSNHEELVNAVFTNFQLSSEDIEGLEIHLFTIEEIEEKCYAIIGKKMAKNANYSLDSGRLPIKDENDDSDIYQNINNYDEYYEKHLRN